MALSIFAVCISVVSLAVSVISLSIALMSDRTFKQGMEINRKYVERSLKRKEEQNNE